MARPPRFVPHGGTIEITSRTLYGRMLMRACRCVNRFIEQTIARALELYRIDLHAYNFMANHWHMVMSPWNAEHASSFVRDVNGKIARYLKLKYGIEGPVFFGRPRIRHLLDDRAILRRIAYVLGNGVKEGLVAHPLQWPGASAARALCTQEDIVTCWSSAADRKAARRAGRETAAATRPVVLRLTPPPALKHLSREERATFFRRMCDEIALVRHIKRQGKPPLGVALVLAIDPMTEVPLERTRVPMIDAGDPALIAAFLDARAAFFAAYDDASRRLRQGELTVGFPPGAIPPRGPSPPWASAVRSRAVS